MVKHGKENDWHMPFRRLLYNNEQINTWENIYILDGDGEIKKSLLSNLFIFTWRIGSMVPT